MFNRFKLYVAIANATENICKYWVLDGEKCEYLNSKLSPQEIEALYAVERREYHMREQFVFMLKYDNKADFELIESVFSLGKTPLDEWDDEDLELVGLRQCYYTDLWDYEKSMHKDINGNLFCENAIIEGCVVVCDDCGKWIDYNDAYEMGCYYVCEDCRENYCYCDCCGEYHKDGVGRWLDRYDMWVCEDCLENSFYYCPWTEDYYNDDDVVRVFDQYGDYDFCYREYAYENHSYCEHCGEFHTYEAMSGEYDDYGNELCEDCWNEYCENHHSRRILEYEHTNRNLKFVSQPDDFVSTKWYIGCELEMTTSRENANNVENDVANKIFDILGDENVVLKRDSSINQNGNKGFELVTMPYSLREWERKRETFNEVLKVCKENKYTSHNNGLCGLHFHVSRTLFGDTEEEQADNIAKLIEFYNKNYDEIVKVSRRTSETASAWADKHHIDDTDCANMEIKKEKLKGIAKCKWGDRYKAVNLTNYHTVEFRLMRGTLNEESFWACFEFTIAIAINSTMIKWEDIDDTGLWLSGMTENTYKYINKRNAFQNVGIVKL